MKFYNVNLKFLDRINPSGAGSMRARRTQKLFFLAADGRRLTRTFFSADLAEKELSCPLDKLKFLYD